jgi:tripartite-type tricarboxylate transporter receptor subunit TctC
LPLYGKLPYDPIRDFAPVAMLAHVPAVLGAQPSFPAKSGKVAFQSK